MNPYVPLAGLCGLGVACGLLLVWHGIRAPRTGATTGSPRRRHRKHRGPWLCAAVAAGLMAAVITSWPVGGLLTAVAVWSLPQVLNAGTVDRQRVDLIEGVASWAEMLRDTLAAAAGLEQAITATAHTAPAAVRPHIQRLAADLDRGERLAPSLRRTADELEDPSADLVLAALILASEQQARLLAPLLGELAASARAQVEMRQRVDASRARTRTTLRVVVTTTLCFSGGLALFNPAFLAPYDSATGQLVLLAFGALFAVAFSWLRRIAQIEEPERFLAMQGGTTAAGADTAREGAAP